MAPQAVTKKKAKGTGAVINAIPDFAYHVLMPRISRVAPGGMVFHVLNRGVLPGCTFFEREFL